MNGMSIRGTGEGKKGNAREGESILDVKWKMILRGRERGYQSNCNDNDCLWMM